MSSKTITFLMSFWLTIAGINLIAQTPEAWKAEAKQEILWQEVTSLGNLIVATPASLLGLDTDTGKEIWALNQFANLDRNHFSPIQGSPLYAVNRNGNISIIEPFNGKELFNSNAAGLSTIDTSFFLYGKNGILISGKKQGTDDPIMLMVNMTDGKIIWQIGEKFGSIIAVEEISDNDILVVTLFTNYRINAKTGEFVWKNNTSNDTQELDKMGKLGGALKAFAEEAASNMHFELRFYSNPNSDVFYIGSQQESQSTAGTATSATTTYTNIYYAYKISDGSLVWQQPLEMKGAIGQVALHPDGMIVLPMDGTRTLINMFNYQTQEGKWGKKAKGIPVKGGIYDYIETGNGYLLVTQSGGKNYLNFLDPVQGALTFEEPLRINGSVVGIQPVEKGILYITTEEINIMDPVTGKFVLPKAISTRPELTSEKDNFIYAFDTELKKVVSLDKNKAIVTTLSKAPVSFEGKESPKSLEIRENGILLSADQNMTLIAFDGSQVYNAYFQAPREPGLKRALLYAQVVRAAYISANSYYGAAAFQSAAPKASDPVAGAIFQGVGEAYEQLGESAADFAKESFQQANKRFKATSTGRDFQIILTQTDKTIELVKANKNTGQVEGRINMGKEKSPIYAVDDITGQVYLRSAPNTITSYIF